LIIENSNNSQYKNTKVNKSFEVFSIREKNKKRNEEIIKNNSLIAKNNIKKVNKLEKIEAQLLEKLKNTYLQNDRLLRKNDIKSNWQSIYCVNEPIIKDSKISHRVDSVHDSTDLSSNRRHATSLSPIERTNRVVTQNRKHKNPRYKQNLFYNDDLEDISKKQALSRINKTSLEAFNEFKDYSMYNTNLKQWFKTKNPKCLQERRKQIKKAIKNNNQFFKTTYEDNRDSATIDNKLGEYLSKKTID